MQIKKINIKPPTYKYSGDHIKFEQFLETNNLSTPLLISLPQEYNWRSDLSVAQQLDIQIQKIFFEKFNIGWIASNKQYLSLSYTRGIEVALSGENHYKLYTTDVTSDRRFKSKITAKNFITLTKGL